VRGRVRGEADEEAAVGAGGVEHPPDEVDRHVRLADVHAVHVGAAGEGREEHVDAVVDEEQRAGRGRVRVDRVRRREHGRQQLGRARVLVADLHGGRPARDRRGHDGGHAAPAAERRVGDEVDGEVDPAHETRTRSATSSGVTASSASRNATANEPGPDEAAAAISAAIV
jgi:hypothetical protein